MIYRFEILAKNGLFEGWAHDPDEMRVKFLKEYPGESGKDLPYIFLSGSAPRWLKYSEYQMLHEGEELSDTAILILDKRLAEMYELISADSVEGVNHE